MKNTEKCPDWCELHPEFDPQSHTGTVTVEGVELGLCQDYDETPTIHYDEPDLENLTPARAQRFAAALLAAVRVVDQ